MRILLACGGGMSSSLLAQNLTEEAKKHGDAEFFVQATSTENVSLNFEQDSWDVLLLAPQVSFRKDYLQQEADAHGVPVILIEGLMYTPMGAPALYQEIVKQTATK